MGQPNLLPLIEQFVQDGTFLRGWTPETVRTYRYSLRGLPPEISKASLNDLVAALRQRGLSPGGINLRVRSINSFQTWLHEEGHLGERRLDNVPMKETAKDVLRWVSAKLPAGAHASLLEGATTDAWNLLRLAAKKCDVTSVGVTGEYGRIVGSVVDTAVLPIYARTGHFAKRTNDLIASFFNGRDGQYLDVGANIGLTTVPIAQQPRVQCLAIEADPTNFSHLSANVGMNCPHRNVTLRHCAVFNRRGTIDLQLSPDNVGDHRVRVHGQAGVMGEDRWRTVSVPAEPLDALVSSIAHPFVAKVDVQGAEPVCCRRRRARVIRGRFAHHRVRTLLAGAVGR